MRQTLSFCDNFVCFNDKLAFLRVNVLLREKLTLYCDKFIFSRGSVVFFCVKLFFSYNGLFKTQDSLFWASEYHNLLIFEAFWRGLHPLAYEDLLIVGVIDTNFLFWFFGLRTGLESVPGACIATCTVIGIYLGFSAIFLGARRAGGAWATWLHVNHLVKYPSDTMCPELHVQRTS